LLKASDFRSAFSAVRSHITVIQWKMLEAHFYAPGQVATAGELGLAAGYPPRVAYRITNAVYSALGRRLRTELGLPARQKVLIEVFARGLPRDSSHPQYRFALRPSATKALASLGWFAEEGADPSSEFSAEEGRLVVRLVRHRSRERSLRRAKLAAVLAASPAHRLICEVPGCCFDFESSYGPLGRDFAEVHHLRPLADLDGPIETTLADLAVVCANCHRMLHQARECLTLTELGRHRARSLLAR
jgi:predicted HNH restriction endonuclease